MQNAMLDKSQVRIGLPGEISKNLRCVNDTTLIAEREDQLKFPLIRVREESERAVLKLNIKKMEIMASGAITSWQVEGKKWNQ